MRDIKLKLGTATSTIIIGCGNYERLEDLLAEHGISEAALVVSQPNIFAAIDTRPVRRMPVAMIPNGERAKTLRTVERLIDQMLELKMSRQSTVIAVGGGVVGDVAGFAASLFLRGIPIVQVPTTMLAQVDSSVGGKTGVNHRVGKNLIGAFHQPKLVVVDPLILSTLPAREYRSGLYETLKYGVIRDRSLFGRIERQPKELLSRNPEVLEDLIYSSLLIKAKIVSDDEKENGVRRILNFGHTIGHGIEAAAGYRKIRHGEAVGFGMIGATEIAQKLGLIDRIKANRIIDGIHGIGKLPDLGGLSVDSIFKSIRYDKKVRDGKIHFVLPERIGSVQILSDVPSSIVRSVLKELIR